MLEELRLNPRSQAARSEGRRPGGAAVAGDGKVGRRFSTGFAERRGARSTGSPARMSAVGRHREVAG